jgi:hypothetical protein
MTPYAEILDLMELDPKHPSAPRAQRYSIQIPLKYRPSGMPGWWEGRTENISRSGVLFRTDHLMPLQTPVDVLMSLPDELGDAGSGLVVCEGRVVRTEPPQPDDPRPAVAVTIASYRLAHSSGSDPQGDDPRGVQP